MNKYEMMSLDDLLIHWRALKENLEIIKVNEMKMRKVIVAKAFPDAKEGTNTKELGNGYELKINKKFNYKLDSNISIILKQISEIGNEGSFIAEQLVKLKPELVLSEYRKLQENGSEIKKQIKNLIDRVLTITDATPTLEIKAPK